MEVYVMDDNDKSLINKILELNSDLLSKYEELNIYPVDSKEYFILTNRIYSLKYQINKLLEKVSSSLKLQSYMEYLYPKGKINNFSEDLKILINGDREELIKRRLLISLLERKIEKDIAKLSNMASTLNSDIVLYGIPNLQEFCHNIYNPCDRLADLLRVSNALRQDFIKSLGVILEDNGLNKNNHLNFLYESLEEELLKENYDHKHIYFTSKLDANLASFTDSEYNASKSMYGFKTVGDILDEYPDIFNNQLLLCVIKTALLFCTPEELKILKDKYGIVLNNVILDNQEYQESVNILSLK